jgi:hypothetical protein
MGGKHASPDPGDPDDASLAVQLGWHLQRLLKVWVDWIYEQESGLISRSTNK